MNSEYPTEIRSDCLYPPAFDRYDSSELNPYLQFNSNVDPEPHQTSPLFQSPLQRNGSNNTQNSNFGINPDDFQFSMFDSSEPQNSPNLDSTDLEQLQIQPDFCSFEKNLQKSSKDESTVELTPVPTHTADLPPKKSPTKPTPKEPTPSQDAKLEEILKICQQCSCCASKVSELLSITLPSSQNSDDISSKDSIESQPKKSKPLTKPGRMTKALRPRQRKVSMSSEDDEDMKGKGLKQKRKTKQQVTVLKREFDLNPNWTAKDVKRICDEAGLKRSQVYKWNWDKKKKYKIYPERYFFVPIMDQSKVGSPIEGQLSSFLSEGQGIKVAHQASMVPIGVENQKLASKLAFNSISSNGVSLKAPVQAFPVEAGDKAGSSELIKMFKSQRNKVDNTTTTPQ